MTVNKLYYVAIVGFHVVAVFFSCFILSYNLYPGCLNNLNLRATNDYNDLITSTICKEDCNEIMCKLINTPDVHTVSYSKTALTKNIMSPENFTILLIINACLIFLLLLIHILYFLYYIMGNNGYDLIA